MLCKSTVILIISLSPPSEHIRLTCTFSGWTADAGHRSPQIHLGRVPACELSAHGGQDFHTGQREKGKRSCLFFSFSLSFVVVFLCWLRNWGSPGIWWDGHVCNCFPTPVRTVAHTSAVVPAILAAALRLWGFRWWSFLCHEDDCSCQ